MTRDDGWRLLTIGRQIERLTAMSSALTIMLERDVLQSERERAFALVLGLFDSTITYRSLYQRRQELPALLDLLIFDEENPRALVSMLDVLRREVPRLPDTGAGPVVGTPRALPRRGRGHHAAGAGGTRLRHRTRRCDRADHVAHQSSRTDLSAEIALRYFSIVGDLSRTIAR